MKSMVWKVDVVEVYEFEPGTFKWYHLADMEIGEVYAIDKKDLGEEEGLEARIASFNQEYGRAIWYQNKPRSKSLWLFQRVF